jgi:G3E family GTPase
VNVDTAWLERQHERVVSIPGGSIFCRCLVTEFVARLREVIERHHTLESPVEGVVIEASGMADPLAMADLLRETRLDAIYRLARVICVAEPRSVVRLVETLPAVASQIRAADLVLLNKVDLFNEAALVAAEAAIRSVRPDAPVVRCVRCETDVEPFGNVSAAVALHGDLAPCFDPHFVSATVPVTVPLDPQRLADALRAAESSWFRVKGYVPVNGGMAHFDFSATGATWREAPATMPAALVLIARGGAGTEVRSLVERLRSGALGPAPTHGIPLGQ